MADGLLDFLKTPEGQGLLSMVAGGMAGARQGQPINSLGRAGIAGLAGYGGALDRQSQMAQQAEAKKLRDLQMQQMQGQMQQQQTNRDVFSRLTAPQVSEPVISMNEMGLPNVDTPSVQTPGKFDPIRAVQMGMSPDAVSNFQQIYERTQPKTEVYKPGDVVYKGGKPVMTVPKEPSVPSAIQEYQYAQQDPAFAAYQQSLKRAGATQVPITIGQEKAEAKKVGEFFGEQYSNIQGAGFTAQRTIDRFNRLGQLLDGVSTGKFADLGLEVAKTAAAAGFNIDPNMPNKEAARALSSEMALQLRNPAGGAGMPGAMSNKDLEFLQQMTPSLATTPEGRKMMIDTATKLAKRDMEIARMARDYRKRKGSLDEGFYEELTAYSSKNPLFADMASKATGGAKFLGFE